jgi:hypothetical protein
MGTAANGQYGLDLLSISVLTSDEINFSTVISPAVSPDNITDILAETYARARAALAGSPSFIIAYAPFMPSVAGAVILDQLKTVSGGGIPIFGGLACDHPLDFLYTKTFRNEVISGNSVILLLMEGEIRPQFFMASISTANMQRQYGIITESKGCIVKKVNDMPFVDYLRTIGLPVENFTKAIPLMVSYKDGAIPLARAVHQIIEEDGSAICGGNMPVNATIIIGQLKPDDILLTAQNTAAQALKAHGAGGMFINSCLSRNLMLGKKFNDEMQKVMTVINQTIPYQMCYMGGEICPVKTGKELVNRFHNFTFAVCVF